MFAPNAVPDYHHRSYIFEMLLACLESAVLDLAELPRDDWDVLFLTGSGALGLEACMWSAMRPVTPLFAERPEQEFGRRLADLTFTHNKHGIGTEDVAFVQYETALSELNTSGWKSKGVTIVDAVSAFPFHPIPFDADIVVTVSGKQLSAPPGIAIVMVHKRCWDGFLYGGDRASYLNLSRYRLYKQRQQTPNTPAITVLQDLYAQIRHFDKERHVRTIQERFDAVSEVAGRGPIVPPVFTFKRKLTGLHEHLGLYGKKTTQLFLWSGSNNGMDYLLNNLRRYRNENPDPALWWA